MIDPARHQQLMELDTVELCTRFCMTLGMNCI